MYSGKTIFFIMTPSITNEMNFVKYIVKKEDIMLQIRIANIYNFVPFKDLLKTFFILYSQLCVN